ncbi:helix-turn-helix transcriptional regulator [Roseobacter litoralis]|uniref:Helix-turn-helix protein n=1 Tax=Roseobacter litoralis (strain ATCC 49566 / DSM 6996 / JCM 21268 / NBRC 15278 / OCh 149) TaxID=391595 RepID=F7ZKH0_ROSLO|nr:helix-turn-helix transcriptional regulator [Roseobacter litoralis]AEI95184.1 putative helix-turn-helix protein [Roseobacter litoralis Och 149]
MKGSAALPVFGTRLRRVRTAVRLKQDGLAELLGVDQATVSRWERGVQTPEADLQAKVFQTLLPYRSDDAALRRLVETSPECVHLVDEATHVCLAYSAVRARDWQVGQRDMLGISLWQFATEEIQKAEHELGASDWWSVVSPEPRLFETSQANYRDISISAGQILWERVYLSDGTPARLVSGRSHAA